MKIDHKNFKMAAAPVYEAVAEAYDLLADAYWQVSKLANAVPVQHDFSPGWLEAAFEDAAEAAEKYACHCACIARLFKDGETEEKLADYDLIFGPKAQKYASIQIREAQEIFAETMGEFGPDKAE